MSIESGEKLHTYTLKLDFDVDQLSTALRFNLLRNDLLKQKCVQSDGTPAMQDSGHAAGGYHLLTGDVINILIRASYETKRHREREPAIEIKGLTLVALPAPYGTRDSSISSSSASDLTLSPCDAGFATCHFDDWTPKCSSVDSEFAEKSDSTVWHHFTTSQSFGPASSSTGEAWHTQPGSTTNLTIIAASGLWQIAGFLSVLITTERGVTHRVYTFDPDLMVGPGNTP